MRGIRVLCEQQIELGKALYLTGGLTETVTLLASTVGCSSGFRRCSGASGLVAVGCSVGGGRRCCVAPAVSGVLFAAASFAAVAAFSRQTQE